MIIINTKCFHTLLVDGSATILFFSVEAAKNRKKNQSQFYATPSVRRTFHIALQVYKITKKLCPNYLYQTVRYSTDVNNRGSLRNPHRLYVPAITNFGKKCLFFYFKCTQIWNRLSSSLYTSVSTLSFKSNYKLIYNIV